MWLTDAIERRYVRASTNTSFPNVDLTFLPWKLPLTLSALTFPASSSLVNITIAADSCSHIRRQKSSNVSGTGA